MKQSRPAPTILSSKQHDAPSVFAPSNLLREARRQRRIPDEPLPAVRTLDPDGDIVRHLRSAGTAHLRPHGYEVTKHAGVSIGIVGCAVGARCWSPNNFLSPAAGFAREHHLGRADHAQGAAALFLC